LRSTSFFRDADAFEFLGRAVIPQIFANKGVLDAVRVWSVGCATGEEAYSLAILLAEHAAHLAECPRLQIFATDINQRAIAAARKGRYPATIAVDVGPERLRRFFIHEGDHYQVKKELRQMVLFAPHNLLCEPSFSRLDFISCRNLLVYFSRDMQERALRLFHFSIRPGGFLSVGALESAEMTSLLFSATDEKSGVYRRQGSSAAHPEVRLLAADWLAIARDLVHAIPGNPGETLNEELNQELRLINEEWQSTAEELESGREELRSVNDELTRVNRGYNNKIEELGRVNGDLLNLTGANDIATIFLDRTLRINRFTPRAQKLFNITANDLRRSIGDFTCQLDYPNLAADAEQVLRELQTIEREVPTDDGSWYLARLTPYRSVDDRIDGVVVTFIDVTNRRLAEDALRQADRNKDQFLAALSHELRNPLAAILSSVRVAATKRQPS
jgi:two-component system, chemotaxis family, CheB/CheR fusion protein